MPAPAGFPTKPRYNPAMRRDPSLYQLAMESAPDARAAEFRLPLELSGVKAGMNLMDFPSGGGYLRQYLAHDIEYLPVETVSGYRRYADVLMGDWTDLPVSDQSVDVVISIAALHHLTDQRIDCYREVCRVLRPGGCLVIADVAEGSPPSRWLDDYVDQHSSEGHTARFFTGAETALLREAGFDVPVAQLVEYPWLFSDRQQMVGFCRGLFRLDRPTDQEIDNALEQYLGTTVADDGSLQLNWSLMHFKAVRNRK